MGRKRKKDKHLPPKVYKHYNQYRLHLPGKPPKVIGRVDDYAGMLTEYARIMGGQRSYATLADVFNRYLFEITPTKAKSTHKNEHARMMRLIKTFGQMPPNALQVHHVAKYRDLRAQKNEVDGKTVGGPVAAKHEVQLLKHVMNMAAEWGAVRESAIRSVKPGVRGHRAARPYVTDEAFEAAKAKAPPMIALMMECALLTGLRRGDIAAIDRDCITDDGLVVQTTKTDKPLRFKWTPALREVIDAALARPPQVRRYVFCNTKGQKYVKNALDSAWQRLMAKCEQKFDFRSIRRKSARDTESLEAASKRLGHTDERITRDTYRSGRPEDVEPLK